MKIDDDTFKTILNKFREIANIGFSNMTKVAKFIRKTPYGNELFYPDCEFSGLICALLMQKAVTALEIRVVKEYGWVVEIDDQGQ